MSRPNGFSMSVNENPEAGAQCDICIELQPPGVKRISTYIGTSPQSDLCMECAADVTNIVRPRRVPADGKLRVEAVV